MEMSEEFLTGEFADEAEEIPADYDIEYDDDDDDDNDDSLMEGEDTQLSDSDVNDAGSFFGKEKMDWNDHVNLIHMRRYIDQLADKVEEKTMAVQTVREELKRCQDYKESLQRDKTKVTLEIKENERIDNIAVLSRLQGNLDRICQEISNEEVLEKKIMEFLDKAEYELAQAQVEQGKMLLMEDSLAHQEAMLQKQKTAITIERTHKEQDYAHQTLRTRRVENTNEQIVMNEQRKNHERRVQEAIRSQTKANKYLEKTMAKIRLRENEEKERQRDHVERRMQTMLKLKKDIANNRENLRAVQARDEVLNMQRRAAKEAGKQSIEAEGGNSSEIMTKQKRLEEFEKEKQLFAHKQRERQAGIAAKILFEEDQMKQRKKQHPHLFPDKKSEAAKTVTAPRRKKTKLLEADTEENTQVYANTTRYSDDDAEDDESNVGSPNSPSRDLGLYTDLATTETGNSLAKPEFEGMWDKHKSYKAPTEMDISTQTAGHSKMEKDIMKKVLEKHRDGIIIKQIAAGKEFNGQPFYSKPHIIHFKDFEVGQVYKKKIVLTNVSYTVNYCKLVGLTEHLKDFIELQFDPPGQMSAGLTCELQVIFKPMINEDLEGTVQFLAQTGPFSIPLVCTTKKCELQVDKRTVEFGVSVIGETVKRTVVLSNNGALGTKFEFCKVSDIKMTVTTAESSLEQLTATDINLNGASPDSAKGLEIPDVDMDDMYSLDGMTVGNIQGGEIGPFSTAKLEIIWQPTIPGRVDIGFFITFEDPNSQRISITALANAIDVPVWVERETVDLNICMFDRLYQDTVVVNNRASTALRLKFEVCSELKNHLELLPKTGYIQAQSQFSAQLKFLPRKSLFDEACQYIDKETGVLEAPLTITVADQTRPVPFTVHAVVTQSELEFDISQLDFGHCTLYEAVTKTVSLTNHSILPQQFGFLGIPDFMDVQPNDGFGTLLPLETVQLDFIFKPSKAGIYNFDLTCKSLINRQFKISCRGIGVHPPLELSHQLLHFRATAIGDVSNASVHIINNHTNMNEFTHPVPRIGKGDIAPVGPTSFEFVVPPDSPISISPLVGTVMPGKKVCVHVQYMPRLGADDVRREAVRMINRAREVRALEEYQAALMREKELQEQPALLKGGKKPAPVAKGKASPKAKGRVPDSQMLVTAKGPAPIEKITEDNVLQDSAEYTAAHTSLVRGFKGHFQSFVIPCYVASGKCANPGELQYSVHNTLYLEVYCPMVRPDLVVLSDNGRTLTDFNDKSIGQSVIKSITVQNISDTSVELQSSCLDTGGPFSMLNALRVLPPDGSHSILVSFTPHQGDKFQENLEIKCRLSSLHLTLKGRGVSPVVSLSVEGGVFDMGAVISGEYREETFKIVNTSSLSVTYSIKLDSQSLLRHAKSQGLPCFINHDPKARSLVGTQNNNGQQVFDCVPAEGTITAGGSKEITVTFSPDHPSDFYSDGVRIELFGQEEQHTLQLLGKSKAHIMYIGGGDQMAPEVESLAACPVVESEEGIKAEPISVLVTLHSLAQETEFKMASRDIYVGCVRTMAVSQKKGSRQNGEWIFDSLAQINALGFNIDPNKGMLDAGTTRPLTITWTPPAGFDTNQAMEASVLCTVKGDVTEQYRIILRGIIQSE